MQTKSLLYGLIGFFLGGLVVSVAATTFDKPSSYATDVPMGEMTASLEKKTGDDYDKAFISNMIAHHQSAVDMARLSAKNANHEEIKKLSNDIIAAQEDEIEQMRQWQMNWGYEIDSSSRSGH